MVVRRDPETDVPVLKTPLTIGRSSFSETLGRRTIYIISFALFVIFSALSAISTNIGMLIAMRILGGGASASVQAVGAGTIADIWMVFERGKAMSRFPPLLSFVGDSMT